MNCQSRNSRFFSFWLGVFVSISFAGLSGCATTQTATPEMKTLQEKSVLLEKEVQEMKRFIASQEEKTNVALNVVTTFRDKIAELESQIQEMERKAEMQPESPPSASSGSSGFSSRMPPVIPDTAMQAPVSPTSIPKTPSPPEVSKPAPAPSDTEITALYQQGLQRLMEKRYEKALSIFREITRLNPSHPLADNAQYWIGEIFYSQRDFQTAMREFQKVVDLYPEGNKTPDAHLKISFSLIGMGKKEEAKIELERLIARFPAEEVSNVAKTRLEKLNREN
jgi:tol-pal system protein YbgF